ncbi:polyadenylate binding protein [Halteromyces radiatus]|uniref:polyadenylate binding protein n=1 Tax=Halteromyces radiatus TaxID=101107 RepID=UPI00221F217E|nr:polyadenylate binding protein [Halteromyces radiatus]KAI8097056.1 polyadenylate binding protein [Halteromyces radiatus]
MTGTSSPAVQQRHSMESLGPRGLSTKQQEEIALAQGQAAHLSHQQRRSSGTTYGQTSSLYVGELDSTVDEAMLMDIFSAIGPVENIRICRDAITNRSLGYAYVNFCTEIDGARAVQTLNYTLIKGKPCRIMWTQNENNNNKSKIMTGNIFIKNLDPLVTTKSLLDTFSLYGHITSCKIVTDERGRSKGYGFVHYDTTDSAERAINHVNGMTLYDREIFVGHHIPKQERIQRMEEAKQRYTNVYVKNLVADITEEELKELFGGFGQIASVLIQRDEHGISRGFGFVNFERHEDAEKAVSQMHATEYIGKRLFVSRAQKRSEREEELRKQHDQSRHEKSSKYHGVNLYVKNLADDMDDEILKDLFSKFGTITSAKIMRDEKTSQSKGFGFVCFTTPDEASKAVAEMNGETIMNKTIYVALAQKKEDRRHQLEAQMSHQRSQLMHLQQPFVPVPINYMNTGPIYYDPYPHSYPQPGVMTPRPMRWNHPPPTMMKQGYMTGPLQYPSYNNLAQHIPRPPHHIYDSNGHMSPPPPPPPPPSSSSTSITTQPSASMHSMTTTSSSSPTSRPTRRSSETITNQIDDIDTNNDAIRANVDQNVDESELTMEKLSEYPLEMQKQMLGERIYKVVNTKYAMISGKVTGMLLEMDVEDLVYLIKHNTLLEEKMQEAVAVLEQHQQQEKTTTKTQADL